MKMWKCLPCSSSFLPLFILSLGYLPVPKRVWHSQLCVVTVLWSPAAHRITQQPLKHGKASSLQRSHLHWIGLHQWLVLPVSKAEHRITVQPHFTLSMRRSSVRMCSVPDRKQGGADLQGSVPQSASQQGNQEWHWAFTVVGWCMPSLEAPVLNAIMSPLLWVPLPDSLSHAFVYFCIVVFYLSASSSIPAHFKW